MSTPVSPSTAPNAASWSSQFTYSTLLTTITRHTFLGGEWRIRKAEEHEGGGKRIAEGAAPSRPRRTLLLMSRTDHQREWHMVQNMGRGHGPIIHINTRAASLPNKLDYWGIVGAHQTILYSVPTHPQISRSITRRACSGESNVAAYSLLMRNVRRPMKASTGGSGTDALAEVAGWLSSGTLLTTYPSGCHTRDV